MSKANTYELRTYVDKDDLNRIKAEATARAQSISQTLRDCLREYFAIRKELATSIEVHTADNQAQTIIHVLLARHEEAMRREFAGLKEVVFQVLAEK